MKQIKVKDLKPGDVLASSNLKVNDTPGPSKYLAGYWCIPAVNIKTGIHKFCWWKPNTTVSILDK